MKESWRARPLVLEMARRLLILEGRRTDLPPKEFELLAALAAKPREAVPAKDLIEKVWPESSVMTAHDLYWYVWSLRRLIGDAARDDKLIANRRGVGYYLDLSPNQVEILESGHVELEAEEETSSSAPGKSTTESVSPAPVRANDTLVLQRKWDPVLLAAVSVGASAVVALSSLVGYSISRGQGSGLVAQIPIAPTTSPSPDSGLKFDARTEGEPNSEEKDSPRGGKGNRKDGGGGGRGAAPSEGANLVAGSGGAITTGGSGGTTTDPDPASAGDGGGGAGGKPKPDKNNGSDPDGRTKPTNNEPAPPPPPVADATLYHLYQPDSGDHIATTSSGTVAQKQAYGYRASKEGYIFTTQQNGTVPISLSNGTFYVYRSTEAAPSGTSVSTLYRVNADGDAYYTSSTSEVNQGIARGWSNSTVGYVQR